MFIWDFVANPIMDALMDWFYSQIVGFLGAFFAQMGNMGAELFELEWVQAVVLYSLSVALQGTFAQGITGAGSGIGDLGAAILENMESTSLTEIAAAGHWGIGTNPLMLIFCIILMAYAVIKVFFANLKRGGILLIQIAVGSLYMFSIPRGYCSMTLINSSGVGLSPLKVILSHNC